MFVTREIKTGREKISREELLSSRDIFIDFETDDALIIGIFSDEDGEEKLAATATLSGNIIKFVGVDPEFEGCGLASQIITSIIKRAAGENIFHLMLFTSPAESAKFSALGFDLIAKTAAAALLEWGKPDINDFCEKLSEHKKIDKKRGVCVMNCNPFTLGHRYLIERAASMVDWLYILVVEEDKSYFPFSVRFEMVRRGTDDLKNVEVLPSGKYVISAATFPSYFIKDRGGEKIARVHSLLDIEIFAAHIAPALGVSARFVGSEPFCPVTSIYNEQMKKILPLRDIEVVEIERLRNSDEAISASRVRKILESRELEKLKEFVPESTVSFL